MQWLFVVGVILSALLIVIVITNQSSAVDPATIETPSFRDHIRPLFRSHDVSVMKRFGMDLSDYSDVSEWADRIYERVADGSMPCDGGWSANQVALFKKWMDTGKQP